jgi:hypothetical protein
MYQPISPYVSELSTFGNDNISNFNIYYEKCEWRYKIPSAFEREIKKWHQQKYNDSIQHDIETLQHDIESLQDTEIIKYKTKHVTFTLIIVEKDFYLYTNLIQSDVDGFNVKTFLKKNINDDTASEEYIELKNLNKKIIEEIISENKSLNEEYEQEVQELCAIEYAGDMR